jgi:hypothetical protein
MEKDRREIELLGDDILSIAQKLLEKQGEFIPFARVMDINGEILFVHPDTNDERPKSKDLVNEYTSILNEIAIKGKIKAAGIGMDVKISDVKTGKISDAICVKVENNKDEAIELYLLYQRSIFGKIEYKDLKVNIGKQEFFIKKN